jgi:hypothetical protein
MRQDGKNDPDENPYGLWLSNLPGMGCIEAGKDFQREIALLRRQRVELRAIARFERLAHGQKKLQLFGHLRRLAFIQ